MPADRIKTIAFEWSGNTYVFEAGKVIYEPEEDREDFQLANLDHDFQLNGIDLFFTVFLGYLDQQLNGGTSYQLHDSSTIGSAPSVGVVDVLNALIASNTTAVYFYPALEDNAGNVNDSTKYRVLTNNARFALIESQKAGRFNPYIPVLMKVKTPLWEYPSWANR